jgi:hypothetical protein
MKILLSILLASTLNAVPSDQPPLFGFEDRQYVQPTKCSDDLKKLQTF